MDFAPEIQSHFVGKRIAVGIGADGVPFITHPVGADDGGPWLDLEGDGATRHRLRALGIGRAAWNAASEKDRALLRGACDTAEQVAYAAQALLGVAPDGAPPDLAAKAAEYLRAVVKTSANLASGAAGFDHARERHLFHHYARSAVHPLTKLLRVAKRDANAGTRTRFTDSTWQDATARAINSLLASYALAQVCSPAALAGLRMQQPSDAARGLLSLATGLSEDDLRRDAARQNRGQPPLP